MTKEKWRTFLVLVSILAVLTALAIIGMVQIFNAADEARHSVKVTQCQNIILGKSIHNFHVAFAKIEASEHDPTIIRAAERKQLLKDAINEPDVTLDMKACKDP